MKIIYLLALLLMLFSSIAYSGSSECTYDGKSYLVGSVIGLFKCVDGKWVSK